MSRLSIICLLSISLLAAACRPPRPTPLTPTATNVALSPTARPTTTATPNATPSPAPIGVLAAALLASGEIPLQWQSESRSNADEMRSGSTTVFLCEEFLEQAHTRARARFHRGDNGPFLTEVLAAYAPDEAADTFARLQKVAGACSQYTATLEDGARFTVEVRQLDFPTLGDETLALRLSSDEAPLFGRMQTDSIKIRRGDIIISLTHLALGADELDTAVTEEVARVALQKVVSTFPPAE